MANVSKISGSGGSIDPTNNRTNGTPKKNFQDLMKVDKTDSEQKKKKKSQAEQEEDRKSDSIQALGQKIHTPTPGEISNFEKKTHKIEKAGESEKRQPKKEKRTEEEIEVDNPKPVRQQTYNEGSFPLEQEEVSSVKKRKIIEESALEQEEIEENDTQFEHKVEEVKSTKKTEAKKQDPIFTQSLQTPISTVNLLSSSGDVAPAYASLNPEMLALFERLAGSMSVMHTSGITETTIELNASEFSKLAGTKIVITEHSTAPKVFNIELLATNETLSFFSNNASHLATAFKNGHYAFKINRIETSLLEKERPLFHRKEKIKEKDEDEK